MSVAELPRFELGQPGFNNLALVFISSGPLGKLLELPELQFPV